jgi:galactokinase
VPCGILDQSASTLARDGHARLLDCRDSATAQIPLDMAEAGMALLVIDTRAKHSHASGEYADRRSACVSAAATLGVAALRDVDDLDTALARLGDNEMRGRVRHVVTENRRVRTTADLLRHSRFDVVGTLLTESHASLRDDFNVSSPELDLAVDAANNAGALGARMTGGGFGGCVIALAPAARTEVIADAVQDAFAAAMLATPVVFPARPVAGVHRVGES